MYCEKTTSYFDEIKSKYSDINFTEASLYDSLDLEEIDLDLEKRKTYITRIDVKNMDTFDAAKVIIKNYKKKPLVLNMASEMRPGGGWRKNAIAQEEVLFYKSTYSMSLESKKDDYPLNAFECVYSPNVLVFMDNSYNLMDWDKCFMTSCLALPGIRRPTLSNGKMNSKDKYKLEKKIDMIFRIALIQDHQHLVLGALGCGVFKNPPKEVAEVFKKKINVYGKYFESIMFAVLCVGDKTNYDVFSEILTK